MFFPCNNMAVYHVTGRRNNKSQRANLFTHALSKVIVNSNMAAESLNEEIEYVKLYRIRPILLHFYLAPFIPIYLTWLYFWTVVYGVTDYFEAGLIALAAVGLLQILSCLFCHWSVHVRCFFTCSGVRNKNKKLSSPLI